MPDYRRLVSYIYNYEKGLKRNNVGYARVEARNGQCKYTLHVTAPSLNERHLKAYMFKRNEGGLTGILLGTLTIRNGVGELKGQTESEHLMNTSYTLDDIGGIVIYLSDDKFFATEWDDLPINMEIIVTIEGNRQANEPRPQGPKEEQKEYGEKNEKEFEEKNKAEYEEKSREKLEDNYERKYDEKDEEECEEDIPDTGRDKERDLWEDLKTKKYFGDTPKTDEEEIPETWEEPEYKGYINVNEKMENKELPNGVEEVREENKEQIAKEAEDGNKETETTDENEKENVTESVAANKAEVESSEKLADDSSYNSADKVRKSESSELKVQNHGNSALPMDDRHYNNVNEPCGFHYTNGCRYAQGMQRSDYEDHPLAKRIYNDFPRMFPFEDNEIAWCVRIEPQDIGMLPMESWILGNNSFLLHGYYSYRHLIFARMNYKNGYFYIIGVPGIYHNREKFMARMFGFENFKCVKNRERKTGEFGYWYIPVLLN
ncbi:MAG: hypothetical protein K0R21_1548 [Anaerocolumna sp.]|jgi:hypothetical protein|nr:hypothetical protein [Anaerocolumna sp.]